jgi:hypothetical protein
VKLLFKEKNTLKVVKNIKGDLIEDEFENESRIYRLGNSKGTYLEIRNINV